ncbi:MAG: hypothetical protein H6707_05010 [Deltaproteobacteria bacterium]|nr:hypothetical protein [Deltaproteobacteria bacterium]
MSRLLAWLSLVLLPALATAKPAANQDQPTPADRALAVKFSLPDVKLTERVALALPSTTAIAYEPSCELLVIGEPRRLVDIDPQLQLRRPTPISVRRCGQLASEFQRDEALHQRYSLYLRDYAGPQARRAAVANRTAFVARWLSTATGYDIPYPGRTTLSRIALDGSLIERDVIELGGHAPGLLARAAGSLLLYRSASGGPLLLLDAKTGRIKQRIALDDTPPSARLHAVGSKSMIALLGTTLISLKSGRVIGKIEPLHPLSAMYFDDERARLYLSGPSSEDEVDLTVVSAYDLRTATRITSTTIENVRLPWPRRIVALLPRGDALIAIVASAIDQRVLRLSRIYRQQQLERQVRLAHRR